MEKVSYLGLPNCYRLWNESVEVIVSTDVGPRVLRYAFVNGPNVFAEVPGLSTRTALGDWKPWAGHRLWVAPEAMPGSYAPDNDPIQFAIESQASIRLQQPVDKAGIEKQMMVTLAATGTLVTVHHRITNRNPWPIRAAAWASTVVRGGGTAIIPQEPYRSHDQCLGPARAVVLWYFTKLTDPRWRVGEKYICLSTDQHREQPQKIGVTNRQGWCACHSGQIVFLKRFDYQAGATYPDFDSNNETYTTGSYMEVESLGPLRWLEPGEAAEHVEQWSLFAEIDIGRDEAAMERALAPLLAQTEPLSRR